MNCFVSSEEPLSFVSKPAIVAPTESAAPPIRELSVARVTSYDALRQRIQFARDSLRQVVVDTSTQDFVQELLHTCTSIDLATRVSTMVLEHKEAVADKKSELRVVCVHPNCLAAATSRGDVMRSVDGVPLVVNGQPLAISLTSSTTMCTTHGEHYARRYRLRTHLRNTLDSTLSKAMVWATQQQQHNESSARALQTAWRSFQDLMTRKNALFNQLAMWSRTVDTLTSDKRSQQFRGEQWTACLTTLTDTRKIVYQVQATILQLISLARAVHVQLDTMIVSVNKKVSCANARLIRARQGGDIPDNWMLMTSTVVPDVDRCNRLWHFSVASEGYLYVIFTTCSHPSCRTRDLVRIDDQVVVDAVTNELVYVLWPGFCNAHHCPPLRVEFRRYATTTVVAANASMFHAWLPYQYDVLTQDKYDTAMMASPSAVSRLNARTEVAVPDIFDSKELLRDTAARDARDREAFSKK